MQQQTLKDYEPTEQFECSDCDRSFGSKNALNSHRGHQHTTRIDVECEACGESDTIPECRAEVKENHFCSRDCYHEWRNGQYTGEDHWNYNTKEIECSQCSTTMLRPKSGRERSEDYVCSTECHGKLVASKLSGEDHVHWTGDRAELDCEVCSDTFEVPPTDSGLSQRFCSKDCARYYFKNIRRGRNHHRWKGGHTIYAAIKQLIGEESWARTSAKAREKSGDECQMCGTPSSETYRALDVHHIIPIMAGGTNGQWNLMVLCCSCHRKAEEYTRQFVDTRLTQYR